MSKEVGGHACRGRRESKGVADVPQGAGYLHRLLWPSGSDAWSAAARARQDDQFGVLPCSQLAVQTWHQIRPQPSGVGPCFLGSEARAGTVMIERRFREGLWSKLEAVPFQKSKAWGSAFDGVRHEKATYFQSCHQGRSGSVRYS